MRSSLIILAFFLSGLLLAYGVDFDGWTAVADYTIYALYVLLFLVGVGVGSSQDALAVLRRVNWKIILVPLAIVLGTMLGVGLVSLALSGVSLREGLAVGAGFGYYSLSSIVISQLHSEQLGVVALLANVLREMLTLLLTPLMVRYFGKLAPIAAGGATAMDTTLPIITRFTGSEYAVIAVFSGLVLTVLVPFLVTLILQ
ncbi:MAG: lysine exporter LysO family protein [Ardenticatenaceae bacterium]|nr:lysine exporter LysO family protein [Anaerolineales bacterium]MCB8920249.1 lysine exporter LysO family protein [Ardenticatenaceae bacterium]MCB8991982.1 lysine exporter LysO family protein [Ardenticatenaceae bacterium]MCB9004921.1 lysine exporter LysO family protein [Ardenticatenaceae bacterium]